MRWDIARCTKVKFCDFTAIFEDDRAKVEQCIYCGRKEIYRKVGGRTDNVRYLRMHVRNFCQPHGPTRRVFEEVYGRERLVHFDKTFDKKRYVLGKSERRAAKLKETLDFYSSLGQSSR